MGLFGGKSEDELRATGTPVSARVTYLDDSGKRRNDGAEGKVKYRVQIEGGSSRGRELEKTKWVPVTRMPRMGDIISIRIDADGPDDWAWGDMAMYQPASAPPAPSHGVAPGGSEVSFGGQPGAVKSDPFSAFFGGGAGGNQSGWTGNAFGIDVGKMIGDAMANNRAAFEYQAQVINATGDPEMRKQVLDALKMHGIDIEAMQQGAAGADGAQTFYSASSSGTPPAIPPAPGGGTSASANDLASRLKRLDDLRAQGLINDAEHAEQRQRIIDEI